LFTIACGFTPDLDSYVDDRSLAHRGPTHTLPFATLLAILAGGGSQLVVGTPLPGALAAMVGVLSHLAGDALNPMGVPVAWPVTDRHYTLFDRDGDGEEERGVCRAGDELANRLLVALGGLLTLMAIGATWLPV
jgi:inner membrane protein